MLPETESCCLAMDASIAVLIASYGSGACPHNLGNKNASAIIHLATRTPLYRLSPA